MPWSTGSGCLSGGRPGRSEHMEGCARKSCVEIRHCLMGKISPQVVVGKEGSEFRLVERNGLPEASRGCDQRLRSGESHETEGGL